MKVDISNGVVHLKDVITRKTVKEVNKELFKDVMASATGDFNIPAENLDTSNEKLLLMMTDKIILDGKECEVSLETLDNLSSADYDKVVTKLNEMRSANSPKA